MTPKVTVIMPTYNRANLIEKSIESVLNQTLKDFEFFILDDGSTDNTKEVIQKYLNDSRVKYLYHENQGEAETVNWGWSLASGEYFTQVNSDDTITPDSLEVMVKALDKHKDKVLAYPDFNFIDEYDNITFVTHSPNWKFEDALSKYSCYAAAAGTVIRRKPYANWKTIKRSRFKHINDIEMYWDMALVGDFLHVPKVLASWRVHGGQISSKRYQSIPEIEEWFKYYFNKENLPPKIKKLKQKTRESILNYYIALITQSDLDAAQKEEMIKPYRAELGLKNYDFSCLQIGDHDLIGNKFNGHDLHLYLQEKNIDAHAVVKAKKSKDPKTYIIRKYMAQYLLRTKIFANSDIIHLHLIHNTDFDITYLPYITKLKPTVITLHDPYFTTAHCIYPLNCDKWKTRCIDCPNLNNSFKKRQDNTLLDFELKRSIIQNSNICAIVASDYMEKVVSQSPIWKGKKIYKVPFGINQEIFKPANNKEKIRKELKIDNDSIVIMLRGTESKYKGLETIKKAFKNLDTNKKITVITVNTTGLYDEFKNKFKIKEYGWVFDDKKLAKLYQASDLFLMPSEQEAFGMMAIEAMSCGIPVLSVKGTSLESVTNAPECGFCPDKADFSKVLQYLADNPENLKTTGEKAYQYAREHYNKEVYVNKMIEIYKDIMNNFKQDETCKLISEQLVKYSKLKFTHVERCSFVGNTNWQWFYGRIFRHILVFIFGRKAVAEKYDYCFTKKR